MNKKEYIAPKIELATLESTDVITASGGFAGDWDGFTESQAIENQDLGL